MSMSIVSTTAVWVGLMPVMNWGTISVVGPPPSQEPDMEGLNGKQYLYRSYFFGGGYLVLTEVQKRVSQAIVNIFETGKPGGKYGKVTLLPGDPGHLTYGRSQTTLASGNLYLLIKAYTEHEDSELGNRVY